MPFWGKLGNNVKTFKYKKDIKKDSLRAKYKHDLKQSIRSGTTSIRDAVKLKDAIEAYNTLLLVYGFVTEECSKEKCPLMSAGLRFQYLWANEATGKTDALDAPKYIELLFAWVAAQIDDEATFPTSGDFGKKFLPSVKKILSRLFRVYAHIYYQHLDHVEKTGAKEHLDNCFKHFYYFISQFDLVSEKEMLPLQPLIDQLK